MSLRSKLTVGLGFLFIIIFAIAIYSSFQIEKLSKEASSILKDNYESLVYCKNMLFALDEMNATVGNRILVPSQIKRLHIIQISLDEANQALIAILTPRKITLLKSMKENM